VQGILLQVTIYLAAAVVAVPLSRWLGFGSVLGYLAAGVAIGPALGLVGSESESESVQAFAEYGVVLMLFLIGLEMRPRILWDMRHRLLGLGALQVGLSVAAIAAVGWAALGLRWNAALAVGMILALSSTAIVLQTLHERKLTHTEGGRASIAVLLFQDVAAVPLLAVMPLLAFGAVPGDAGLPGGPETLEISPWTWMALVVGAVGLVVIGSRVFTRPVYRFLALARVPEIQIAGALLLIVGVSFLMSLLGLSPALGSFVAGVVLANSEYRHQLEADLAPFKGLLLGLFFMTVGAGIDLGRLVEAPLPLVGLAVALMALKAAVLWPLARLFHLRPAARMLFALALAQAGEFGFVLLAFAGTSGVLAPELVEPLLLVIALSMALTPALFRLHGVVEGRLARPRPPDPIDEPGTVIVAGMGRFGQTVNRILTGLGHRTVVLDSRPSVVERLRKLGIRGYYGEVDRPEVLAAAGLAEAKVVVVAIDEPDQAVRMVRHIRSRHPRLTVIARARDRHHVYALATAGATVTVREVFESAVQAGRHTLEALGHAPGEIDSALAEFARQDEQMLAELAALWRPDVPIEKNRAYVAKEREQTAAIEAALRRRAAATASAPAGETAVNPSLGTAQ
jgi:monovalent cation:H+ antiporter-2, CPA2 family